ncbi:MAG TPA: ATP-binding protein, partial [Tepidisphaeraceae bacterium]|nr:ATP-binding protein [Tepidisphaeraceae bacterium]
LTRPPSLVVGNPRSAILTRLREAELNFTAIERPLSRVPLVASVQAAVRARRRQFQIRDMLASQQNALRQRDEFLAMLGHELRNPIAAIDLALHLLEQFEWDPQEVRTHKDVIIRQVAHLRRLVDDLLDVSRVTSGRVSIKLQRVELIPLLHRVADAARPGFARKHIRLDMQVPAHPLVVSGDAVRLEQVFANLLSNALKFTDENGTVRLSATADRGQAIVALTDSGRGISPEKLDEIFDLFAQAQVSIDRTAGGVGLRLYLTRRIIDLHGGTVRADSPGLGKGATFTICLPLREPAPAGEASSPGPPVEQICAPKREASKQSVLVVEDSSDLREAIPMLLKHKGHHVLTAADGLEGLAKARASRPAVALVDIGVPGMNGLDLARRLRAELGLAVLVVAMTGYGQAQDRQRSADAGFDHHLVKPVDMVALAKLIAGPPANRAHHP